MSMNFTRENILDIALIFEEANGNTLDVNDSHLVKNSGLSDLSANEIEQMLVDTINQNKTPEYRGSAYWALGKRFNKKLLPVFKKWLAFEVESNNTDALYQLLIALDNLEEQVFGEDREGSYGASDTELNIRDAKAYLENHA